MPIYQYIVQERDNTEEFFEIEQKIDDEPLTTHPITGSKVKRVLTSPTLSLNHSTSKEYKSLSPDNLSKNGFSTFEKDSSGDYYRTIGNEGPTKISAKQIHQTD